MVREFAPGLEVPEPPPPPPPTFLARHAVTLGLALLGGLFAVPGAFLEEFRTGGGALLLPVLFAPVIEEILKPAGVIWLLERRPHYLLSPLHVVLLCMLGALVFASLENLLYIHVYWPLGRAREAAERAAGTPVTDAIARATFVRFRLAVATGLHVTAIVGIGLGRQLVRMRRERSDFDLERSLPFLAAAMVLHGAYNAAAILADRLGWRPWS